jgi:hypothetical protein
MPDTTNFDVTAVELVLDYNAAGAFTGMRRRAVQIE